MTDEPLHHRLALMIDPGDELAQLCCALEDDLTSALRALAAEDQAWRASIDARMRRLEEGYGVDVTRDPDDQ